MSKITSVADLKKKKEQVQLNLGLRENSDAADTHVQIRVGMATCGIASGARETMNFLVKKPGTRPLMR